MIKLFKKIYYSLRKNIYWLIYRCFIKKPKVMSPEETVRLIINENLSVSRFGDGEYRLMSGQGEIGFQKSDIRLSERLLKAYSTRNKNLLICSCNFKVHNASFVINRSWLKNFVYRYYRYLDFFDFNYLYGDTNITRFYEPKCYKKVDFEYLEKKYIPLLKEIWSNKKILIVEGNETKLGLGNDLFANTKSIRRIICPKENAFSKYDDIKECIIKNVQKDELVLLALGPTASVLAVELCANGIRSIDVGHIDVVYLWFQNRAKSKVNIKGKYVNEAEEDNESAITINKNKVDGAIIDEIL